MQLEGRTILITGGGSGIGQGLAEALHARGNKVLVAGRRRAHLDALVAAHKGMAAFELDLNDCASIARCAQQVIEAYPSLDLLINNAGIMLPDNVAGVQDDGEVLIQVSTNFLGPVRLTSALVEHFKRRGSAAIVNVTSGLGFVPFARAATYSATKSALHAYTMAQRFALAGSGVEVIEVVPPRVQVAELQGGVPAMPLSEFVSKVMAGLESGSEEIVVGDAVMLRANPGSSEHGFFNMLNANMRDTQLD